MITRTLLLISVIVCLAACQPGEKEILYPKTDLGAAPLIPKPLKTVATHSAFGLDSNTVIYTSTQDPAFEKVGRFLSEKIEEKIGLDLLVNTSNKEQLRQLIYINQSDSIDLETPESYQLYIKKDSIFIKVFF